MFKLIRYAWAQFYFDSLVGGLSLLIKFVIILVTLINCTRGAIKLKSFQYFSYRTGGADVAITSSLIYDLLTVT